MVILTKSKLDYQSHSRYLEDEVVNQKSLIYNKILNNFHNPKRGARSQLENFKKIPGHGSLHFWLIQAWVVGHSVFKTHSGLQATKGFPMYPLFIHSQTAPPSKTVHSVFVPQGLGLQTSGLGGGRSSKTHLSKGFPINPGGQVQIGLCLSTTHWALIPQLPGHGSWHWVLIQAKLAGQSSCLTHSGLQPLEKII